MPVFSVPIGFWAFLFTKKENFSRSLYAFKLEMYEVFKCHLILFIYLSNSTIITELVACGILPCISLKSFAIALLCLPFLPCTIQNHCDIHGSIDYFCIY